jgi:HEAT repeat protein
MHLRLYRFLFPALLSVAAAAQPKPRPQPFKNKFEDARLFKLDRGFEFEQQFDLLREFELDPLVEWDHQFELDSKFKFDQFEFDHPFEFDQFEFEQPFEFDRPFKVDQGDLKHWSGFKGKGRWSEMPEQGTPEDSIYRQAREALNRGEYRRASELLAGFTGKYPRSRFVPAAMYWQAFALYRVGTTRELEQALRVLDEQRQQYPTAVDDPEVSGLTTRVMGALAARGNTDAAARLKDRAAQGTQSCDREDTEVRAEALSALVQSDPAAALPVLRRILARRDECSTPLRRRAVYLLGREGVGGTPEDLAEVAKNDPDPSVRGDALSRLAQMPGDAPIRLLDQLLVGTSDERTQRAALQALRHSEHPEAVRILRRAVEREDLNEEVRAEAIRALARYSITSLNIGGEKRRSETATLSSEDVALLRNIYEKSTSRRIKAAVLESISSGGGPAADQWLTSIVRNQNEELRYRTAALGRLRRSDVPIEELSKLYDALSERELRSELIRILGMREEPAATDKLIEIVKSGTDPVIRRSAISALSRKNDPRTTKLLLDLVEKSP